MRDGAFPYSDFWVKVNPKTKAPIRSLIFVFLIDAVLLLLPLASDVAFEVSSFVVMKNLFNVFILQFLWLSFFCCFQSIVGISTIGFYVSYGLPIFFKLVFAWNKFPMTEMSLGPYSNICGIFSCLFLFGTSILLFLPPEYPVTLITMNWTCVVVGGCAVIAVIYWFAYASKNFRGPSRKANDMDIVYNS